MGKHIQTLAKFMNPKHDLDHITNNANSWINIQFISRIPKHFLRYDIPCAAIGAVTALITGEDPVSYAVAGGLFAPGVDIFQYFVRNSFAERKQEKNSLSAYQSNILPN